MKLHALLAASCIAVSISAQASNPLKPVELSDQELSQLRGRFVMPGRIVSFGVTMNSVWQNANGQVLGGQVNMQMNEGMFQPQFNVSIVTANGGQNAPIAGTGQVLGGNGLSSVSGVTQSVRSAGDFNSASNDVSINVSHGNSAPAPSQNGQSLNGTLSSVTNAGSVQISPSNGGIQIAIDALGQGSSMQLLGGGGLQQHANITGSSNTVRNLAALDLVLRDSGMAMEQLKANWSQLGALRHAGY